jgi:hypothetical protein
MSMSNECYCCRSDYFLQLYEELVGEPILLCGRCFERIGTCLIQGYSIKNIHIKLRNKLRKQRRRKVSRVFNPDKPRRKRTNRKEYF